MPNTYVALRTETVAVATNSVTLSLSGISGYTDLVLVINNTHSTNAVDGWFRLNGDTGSNYSRTNLNGDGTSATSGRNSNVAFGYGILVLTTPSTNILQFMNYANTTTNKTVLMRSNNTGSGGYVQATVDLWRNTAAITSIEIGCVSGNFAVGSTFNLYGIANADQGAAKATGGIITEDSTYWYHTFGASGAFVPKQSLTCDVLVIAGGGGGSSGGGGAGGLLGFTSQALTATTYNVTVGAGGAGAQGNSATNATNGVDSQFGSLTLVKGGGYGAGSVTPLNGGTGGSGGGGGSSDAGQTNGGSPTSGQGNSGGGNGNFRGSPYPSGGGGGAGAAGTSGTSNSVAGNGGNGSAAYSSWGLVTSTGQNVNGTVYYAGGGGGGTYSPGGTPGIAGFGGGSAGLSGGTATSNATVNTGGGAGGSGGGTAGGTGGSGVVIVRYLKA